MTRAVLDPNVLVAAAITPEGTSAACLRAFAEGRFELVVSPLLLHELRVVLRRERFRPYLSADDADRFVDALERDAVLVADPDEARPVSRDAGDDYLVALARAAAAHVLVTGDDDLLVLELPDLAIASPRQFFERLPE